MKTDFEIDYLLDKIGEEFDDIDKSVLQPGNGIRDVLNWSSINSVVITTMIEYEFNVFIMPEEMNAAVTFDDLYRLIKSKQIA